MMKLHCQLFPFVTSSITLPFSLPSIQVFHSAHTQYVTFPQGAK